MENIAAGAPMDYDRLFAIADQARGGRRLAAADVIFMRDTVPSGLDTFPKHKLPKRIHHPAGFAVSGAPVGTFLRSALLLAGQKALGRRFADHAFYERVESDLAMRIMRSHFHGGAPRGAFCCAQCTLAVLPVLEANAIRYFECRPLAKEVRRMIQGREWRFASPPPARMLQWALAN